MSGSLYAVVMLILLAVTAGLVTEASRSRRVDWRLRIRDGLLLTALLCAAIYLFHIYMTPPHEPELRLWFKTRYVVPWRPWLVTVPCAFAIFLAGPRLLVFRGLMLVLTFALSALLAIHYMHLATNSRHYTARPEAVSIINEADLRVLYFPLLDQVEDDTTAYPAGWLMETAFWRRLPDEQRELLMSSPPLDRGMLRATPEWHTWLTGLYRLTPIPSAPWYPGGQLNDGLKTMTWREIEE